jgi:hypothetical protein
MIVRLYRELMYLTNSVRLLLLVDQELNFQYNLIERKKNKMDCLEEEFLKELKTWHCFSPINKNDKFLIEYFCK